MDLTLDILTFLFQPWMGFLFLVPIALQVWLILRARRAAATAEWDPLLHSGKAHTWQPAGPLREALTAPVLEGTVIWIFLVGVPLYSRAVWTYSQVPLLLSAPQIGLSALMLAGWLGLAGLWVMEGASPNSNLGVMQFRKELGSLSPEAFKVFVAVLFRMRGYQAFLVQRGEKGADLLLEDPAGERELVICAQGDKPLGEFAVRDLHAAMMADEQAVHGYVFAAGGFTHEARAWARSRGIRLIDGQGLMRAVAATNRPEPAAPVPALVTVRF